MTLNRSAPPGPIVPRLIYADVAAAIEWLCAAFGFTERLRTVAEPGGTIHHAQLAVGEGSIILTGQPDFELRPPPAGAFVQSFSVHVEHVDAHFERARRFGARILNPPATQPYGERQYNVEDLAGYQWIFSQSVADVNPEDWGARGTGVESRLAALPRPRWCYLEIPALDAAASVSFYEKVFGWNIRHPHSLRPSFDDATGNVSGAWVIGRPACREPGLLPYIWVDDIDAITSLAALHGAVVIHSPHPDSPGGSSWIATFHDPAGNVIGLYQENHAAA